MTRVTAGPEKAAAALPYRRDRAKAAPPRSLGQVFDPNGFQHLHSRLSDPETAQLLGISPNIAAAVPANLCSTA